MSIPFQLYITLEEFRENYPKDFEEFKRVKGSSNELIYKAYLLEKYEEILGVIERYEEFDIEFSNENTGRKTLSEIMNVVMPNTSIPCKKLGEFYGSKNEALRQLKDRQIRYFDYWEIEILLEFFYIENEDGLKFDDYEYLSRKIDYEEIVKLLSQEVSLIKSFEADSQKHEINVPLDFNLNQTDLVHFFDLLVDADLIKEPDNEVHKNKGGFYGKLATYFTAKGRSINPKSAKTIKANKENKGTPYSQTYYEMLKNLKKTIEQKLES